MANMSNKFDSYSLAGIHAQLDEKENGEYGFHQDHSGDLNSWQKVNHYGKGPIGYKPSDKRIWELANEVLTDDDLIDATDIDVQVENGIIYLSGIVHKRYLKRRAGRLMWDVLGVENVFNRIEVKKDNGIFGDMQDKANMN